MASRTKNNSLPKRLAISAAIAATFITGYGARRAYAGSCTGAAGTYTCSGAANAGTDTTQSLSSSAPLSITTNAGFGITTSTSNAFTLYTSGYSLSFIDTNSSTITGANNGFYIGNYGTGATSITTTGTVTGNNNFGIRVYNYTSTTGLTINSATVNGLYSGISVRNKGKGATSVTSTGLVTGTNGQGILANNGPFATDLTINSDAVNGGNFGIYAKNLGGGAISITSTGLVTSTKGTGVYAYNSGNSTSLTISTAAVTAYNAGIYAKNRGTGATSITSTGLVTSTKGKGVYAFNASNSTDLTINTAAVTANNTGIYAKSYGTGATSITSTGLVTSAQGYGVYAFKASNSTDLTINTAAVTAYITGIYARSYGKGATSITSTGTVTGTKGSGISAKNGVHATDLTINSAAVTAYNTGIYAKNTGTGATSITSTGTVTGTKGNGVYAFSSTNSTSLTISTAAVTGGGYGIFTQSNGKGATSITSTGTVTGTGNDGIVAINYNQATDLTISTAAVSGKFNGIRAINYGSGAISITTTGAVTGGSSSAPNYSGIAAFNRGAGSDVTINASAAVTGYKRGIYVQNTGTGATSITVSGAVTGVTGIYSAHNSGHANTITLNSGASVSAASGNAITLSGSGTNGVLVNSGASVTGSVDLGGIANTMTLNGGTLNVANGFALSVLGNLINTNGIINLRNSTIGAPASIATVSGNFTGGGQLLLNANFATDTADKLNITGNVLAGGTQVGVHDISTGPATGNAITLVSVGGTTAAGDFTLAAPVVNGAYNYNTLALVGKDWVLKSVAASSGGAFTPFAGGFEGLGQNLLTLASLPTHVERNDGRIVSEPTGGNSGDAISASTPIWLRFTGGYRDIDSRSSSTGAHFSTDHWLAQAGIDFTLADNANGRFVAGVNASYHKADTDVKSTAGNSNINTTGRSLGLTGTWYSVNGVYVDTQLQRSWYDTDLSASGVGAGKVNGIGGDGYSASIEVGKDIPLNDNLRITPQVQLAYANVDSDDFTGANAEVVKLSTSKSLKGRLGATLNKFFTNDGATRGFVLANLIREFKDKTQTNVSGALLNNTVDAWTGELGAGVAHAWAKGASSYELSAAATGSSSLNHIGDSTAAKGEISFKVKF